jgi:hypothetical protein
LDRLPGFGGDWKDWQSVACIGGAVAAFFLGGNHWKNLGKTMEITEKGQIMCKIQKQISRKTTAFQSEIGNSSK